MKSLLVIVVFLLLSFASSYSQSIDLSKKIKDINKMVPMKIDEATTLIGATYIGNTIQYNFVVKDEYISLIDRNEYKKNTLKNLSNSETDDAILYFINKGIHMNHAVYDEKRDLRFIVKISPNDFKTVYAKSKKK